MPYAPLPLERIRQPGYATLEPRRRQLGICVTLRRYAERRRLALAMLQMSALMRADSGVDEGAAGYTLR